MDIGLKHDYRLCEVFLHVKDYILMVHIFEHVSAKCSAIEIMRSGSICYLIMSINY
jgi:hypothetical protein